MAHMVLSTKKIDGERRGTKEDDDDQGMLLVKKGMDLVRYSEASLVMRTVNDDSPVTHIEFITGRPPGNGFPVIPKLPGLDNRDEFSTDSFFSKEKLAFILEGMFPTKVWKDGDRIMGRSVALAQSRRSDVRFLHDELTHKEASLGVNKQGHSKIKAQLNLKCLDELIRQETLCCAERGIILSDVRDFFSLYFKIYHRMKKDASALCRQQIERVTREETAIVLREERSKVVNEIKELTDVFEMQEIFSLKVERAFKSEMEALGKVREEEAVAVRKCNMHLLGMLEETNPDCPQLPVIRDMINKARMLQPGTMVKLARNTES